jgi:competence protein ComGC
LFCCIINQIINLSVNLNNMFKKLLIVSLLALCLVTPNLVKAQTVTQEDINAQLVQVINSLLVQVQELMTKLIAMQAQQVADSQTLQTVVTQTTPTTPTQNLGAVETPEVVEHITIGTPVCNGSAVRIPVSSDEDYELIYINLNGVLASNKDKFESVLQARTMLSSEGSPFIEWTGNASNFYINARTYNDVSYRKNANGYPEDFGQVQYQITKNLELPTCQ